MEKRVTQKQLQSQHTRQLLQDAVTAVLAEKGLDRFTVQDICTKANVAVGTFYKYYKTKDDVINDRYSRMDNYFRDQVAPALAQAAPLDGLRRFALFYHDFTTRTTLDVGRQILKARLSGNPGNAQRRDRPVFSILDDLFQRGQTAGEIRSDIPPRQLSDLFMILLRGYGFYHGSHGQMTPDGTDYEANILCWLRAFSPMDGDAPPPSGSALTL